MCLYQRLVDCSCNNRRSMNKRLASNFVFVADWVESNSNRSRCFTKSTRNDEMWLTRLVKIQKPLSSSKLPISKKRAAEPFRLHPQQDNKTNRFYHSWWASSPFGLTRIASNSSISVRWVQSFGCRVWFDDVHHHHSDGSPSSIIPQANFPGDLILIQQ